MNPRFSMDNKPDLDRLEFPCHLAELVGMNPTELSALKRRGCPFFGKKTTLRWVRAFLASEAGAKEPAASRSVRPRRLASSKSGGPSVSSDSRGASLRVRRAQLGGIVK